MGLINNSKNKLNRKKKNNKKNKKKKTSFLSQCQTQLKRKRYFKKN